MNRRTFLKVLAGAVVSAALPIPTIIKEASAVPETAPTIGLIRELTAYDIAHDCMAVRWDVLCEGILEQYSVGMLVATPEDITDELREQVKTLLEKRMAERGQTWADVKPLPIPAGFK